MSEDLYNRRFFRRRIRRYHDDQIVIAKCFYEILGPKSVLDVGCGIGSYLCGFKEVGCEVTGLDRYMNEAIGCADPSIREHLHKQDCGELFNLGRKFDLVICIEVAEHIAPEKSEILIENIATHAKSKILFSAAVPNQRGTGHINCREQEFWVNLFNRHGFILLEDKTFVNKILKRGLMVFGNERNT